MKGLLPRQTLLWLIVAQLLAVLPNWPELLWPVRLINLLCLAWSSALLLGRARPLERHWRLLLTVAALVIVAVTAPGRGLFHSMLAMLVLGYSLKLLEVRSARDVYALVLFGLILVATALIFEQGMVMLPYLLAAALAQLAVVLSLLSRQPVRRHLATLGRVCLWSLPLTILLFLLLPRLSPLWQMPNASSATTGLSDTLNPGDIAQLSRSTELAFRATLPWHPAAASLYWRALTLEVFDGRAWHQANFRQQRPRRTEHNEQPGQSWQLYMASTGRQWLPVLRGSEPAGPGMGVTSDGRIVALRPLSERRQFTLRLPTTITSSSEPASVLALNLRLPATGNPQARALARRYQRQYAAPAQRAAALNRLFADGQYHYSLTPPPLGANAIDAFLFGTRTGFCGHYASALAFLLRASGIPARVVAGYQGGKYLPEGDFYALYQYDAHAWVEAWLPGKGWVRFDPTRQVAPERVSEGFEELAQQPRFAAGAGWLWQMQQSQPLRWLRYQVALLDYRWQRWVVQYDSHSRSTLLQAWLGTRNALVATGAFTALLVLVLTLLHWLSGRRQRVPLAAVTRWYLRACRKLPLARHHGESPADFAQRVAARWPELAMPWQALTELYQRLRYGDADPALLAVLKRQVRALPRKKT